MLPSEKIALSVSEAAELLGVSRPTLYKMMKRADFPAFKFGERVLISRSKLETWIAEQSGGVA